MISRKCASQCPVTVETPSEETQMHDDKKMRGPVGRVLFNYKPNASELNAAIDRAQLTMDPSDYEQETKEQTIRMMHAQINPVLLRSPTVKVNTAEYSFFQEARQIMLKVCPAEDVPEQLLNGLTRMWRLLLWESHDKFAHSENPNSEQFQRIMDLLERCKTDSVPFEFSDEPVTTDDKEEEGDNDDNEDKKVKAPPKDEDGGEKGTEAGESAPEGDEVKPRLEVDISEPTRKRRKRQVETDNELEEKNKNCVKDVSCDKA